MSGLLADWHRQLHENFRSLRDEREHLTPGRPVFALEHGLDRHSELPEMIQVVRGSIASGRMLATSHWLPIIVYAAEIGYDYQGDGYWPRFESKTPCWEQLGNTGRDYIRATFKEFAESYGGARPSGRWAEWFTIIAWPITHAVLPVYLQRQLALLLHNYRNVLTAELLHDHDELGKRLASHSHSSSERFRNFAENSSLLGLVAASLLSDDEEDSGLLRSSTLHRIVKDLHSERQAGEWLLSARRVADTVRRRGFLSNRNAPRPLLSSSSSEQVQSPRLDLELEVRRRGPEWTVYVTVPSYQSLARRFPDVGLELRRLRYRVDGVTTPRVQPRGALMYERGPFPLSRYPISGTSVIIPEGATFIAKQLLIDSCKLPGGPWLFYLRESGHGTEIRTRRVRLGHNYVLLSDPMAQIVSRWCVPVPLSTEGVQAHHLNIPEHVDSSIIRELRELGIGVVSDAQVWPAGLVPARWDGAGRAAWRLGDNPILGIQCTRAASTCRVTVGESTIELSWPNDSDILFLRLVDLDIGTHLVEVKILSDASDELIAEGQLEVSIIEPADSMMDSGARQGLRIMSYPAQPTFSELWTGDAVVVADGPLGERVKFQVSLMSSRGSPEVVLAPFSSELPVDDKRWRALWRTAQGNWTADRGDNKLHESSAQAEELVISASNPILGSFQIRAERAISALRWYGGIDREGPFARLVDQTDRRDIVVDYYDVRCPDERGEPKLDEKRQVRSVYGGLVVASIPGLETGIVLPTHISGNLLDLRRSNTRPSIHIDVRCSESVCRLIQIARLWTHTGLALDNRAAIVQSKVNDALVAALGRMICGDRWWLIIENSVMKGIRPTYHELLIAAGDTPEECEVAGRLQQIATTVSTDPIERSIRFFNTLGLNPEFSNTVTNVVRLATVPGALILNEREVAQSIELVLTAPSIYRLARLFVLTIANYENDEPFTTLRNWRW